MTKHLKSAGASLAAIVVFFSAFPPMLNAQANMHLQVAGIVGNAIDGSHVGWSSISRFEFGIDAPTSLVRTPSISSLMIVKPIDAASVPFMNAAASGTVFPYANLDVFKVDPGSGIDVRLIYIEMKNVRIASITAVGDHLGLHLSEPALETIELQFDDITVTHPVYGPTGQVKENLQFKGARKE